VKGAQSFEDVRTVDSIIYDTFEAPARAHKLIESDEHIINCLDEAVFLKIPNQLRNLFATIIIYSRPSNVRELLFYKYDKNMIEDYILQYTEDIAKDLLLHDINDYLKTEGKSLAMYRLPNPKPLLNLLPYLSNNNPEVMKNLSLLNQQSFNIDKKKAFTTINDAIYKNGKKMLFYLDGPGGSGKTFYTIH